MVATDHLSPQFKGVYIPPERRHAIEQAMPPVYVGKTQTEATPHLSPGNMGKRGRQHALIAQRVARDIMQSTIPPEHLQHGIDRIQVGLRLSEGTRAQYMAYTANDHGYIQTADRYDAKQPSTRVQRESRRRDLVHEIGHVQDPRTHDEYLIRHTGRKEAFAENYADQHLGPTKNTVPAVYDDPNNYALSPRSQLTYARERVKPK